MKMVPESWYYVLGYWIILKGGYSKKKYLCRYSPIL